MAGDVVSKSSDLNYGIDFVHSYKEKTAVLSIFLNIFFPFAIILGGIALIVSLYRSFQHGWYAAVALDISMYLFSVTILLLRRRLPVRFIIWLFLGIMGIAAAHSFCTTGIAGEGMMVIVSLCTFAGVFFGIKSGIFCCLAATLGLSVIGTGVSMGWISLRPDIPISLHPPAVWAIQTGLFLLFTVPLILIINYMQKRIEDGIHQMIDVNERLKMEMTSKASVEDKLRESESRYRNIVENSLVAFSIVQDDRFRFVNSRYCDMTGYTYDELVDALGPQNLIQPDQKDKVLEYYRRQLSGEPISNTDEFVLLKKDGTPITVKALGVRFIYHGKPATFSSLIDITNEKLLESKLFQSEKMEAVGTLAGGIAHDFNNILSALMGFGSMLHDALEDTNPLKLYATQILSASKKAAGLTKSLLTFSRIHAIVLKPLKINAVINDAKALLRQIITEDIDFKIDLSPLSITILADAIPINQILFNLVANARDAMPDGGRLEIRTTVEELDESFILRNGFGKKGSYCRISVLDSGFGMDKTTTEKIFDPFFTTKEIGKGTGLGLSSVYGIVKQHQGYVAVESELNRGTCFHIYFPLIQDETAGDRDTNDVALLRGGDETLLVAEDDASTRLYIKELLTDFGYRIIEAVDGEDGFNKFQHHQNISLVILDAVMPKKNGRELYETIKKTRPDVRALFMSGHTNDIILSKGIIDRSFDFIAKPIHPDKLLVKVREILDRQNG